MTRRQLIGKAAALVSAPAVVAAVPLEPVVVTRKVTGCVPQGSRTLTLHGPFSGSFAYQTVEKGWIIWRSYVDGKQVAGAAFPLTETAA